ncbi:membrane-spanning 4-domains subfamily A member 3-like [Manis pentadactyla]|uniref:membrane-spanning 4-domains subfamily A member 3-like n=1 Tax=Manis pentadactyla TaxID=143292 RepID=UPI00255C3285|nr:membrane-spanning 4-domains subfamily A member 3-like [Manis pentadactyla]
MTSLEVDKLQERLLALGAVEILSGATILVVGVFLGAIQGIFQLFEQYSYFTLYTGYPIWGPVFFIFSGSSSIAAGKHREIDLIRKHVWIDIISAIMAVVGFVLLAINLAHNNEVLKNCPLSESADLCLYITTSNNGLLSLMLIFTLLEFCMAISMTIMWCKRKLLESSQVTSSPPNHAESGTPPDDGIAESQENQSPTSREQ